MHDVGEHSKLCRIIEKSLRSFSEELAEMHDVGEHSRLCRIIEKSLHPFSEELAVHLTKENEKYLLIVLSQILRQIQLWLPEFDSESDSDDNVVKVADSNRKCSAVLKPNCNDRDCLIKLICDLIFFLSVESQFVQHLAGNILVAISDYLIATGSNWEEFMQCLCICLELAISSAPFRTLERPITKVLVSNFDPSIAMISLTSRLKKASWSSVACVVRVLRNILKHLKQDCDHQLLEVYFDSISSCLPIVPWNSLDQICSDQNREALKVSGGNAFYNKLGQLDSRLMFRGTLVQIFCSLVSRSVWMVASGASLNKHPVICEIDNIIPRLLAWCLGDGDRNMCMSEYFRHKMLMLMIRLSFHLHLEYSLLVSWLHLIRNYFDDLLFLPMTQPVSDQNSLEGSPFLAGASDFGLCSMKSCHLQRMAVFLYLRCSLRLFSLRDKTAEECHCATMMSMTSDLECCSTKKGLSEVYWWLQWHLPAEMFVMDEFYYDRCINFSLSFLRLFIHEDDILFEVLLQLFCVALFTKQQCAFEETKDDMLFHVSNLFNPIHLFHLLLAEIQYDHEVLLDYLISKDTGVHSAEYLLRSLRAVCDSWNVFVDFSIEGKITVRTDTYKSSTKKRKVFADVSDILGHLSSSSVKSKGILSPGKQQLKVLMNGGKHYRAKKLPFDNAKDCLLSLKKSMQSLHQKHLFPYNPEVLLQRLTRFQELCAEW